VESWDPEQDVTVGKRRMRAKRRADRSRGSTLMMTFGVLAILGLGAGAFYWFTRPTGLDSLPGQSVIAPGGSLVTVKEDNTVTVGLEISNISDVDLTVMKAEITPPAGVTVIRVTIVPPGPENEGFTLTGELPEPAPVALGADPIGRAIIAGRFKVDCRALLPVSAPTGEQILVTIQVDGQQRVEELTPPVIGDVPWLTASAHRICDDPPSTSAPEPPDPPLPSADESPAG
jgi:hypothetical protein